MNHQSALALATVSVLAGCIVGLQLVVGTVMMVSGAYISAGLCATTSGLAIGISAVALGALRGR